MQRMLSEETQALCKTAHHHLVRLYASIPKVDDALYTQVFRMYEKLAGIVIYGTNDGKPWVDPWKSESSVSTDQARRGGVQPDPVTPDAHASANQVRLSESEATAMYLTAGDLRRLGWARMVGGLERWKSVVSDLEAMATHGTNDGKPWVEPERPIEPGDMVMAFNTYTPKEHEVIGPYKLRAIINDDGEYKYVIGSHLYRFVRRLTDDEKEKLMPDSPD